MSSSIGTCPECRGQTHITESGDGMLWIDCTNCSYRAYRIPPAVLARWDEEDEAERKRIVEEHARLTRQESMRQHGGWA